MGVPGLTSYVFKNSDIYLQNFKLKNTVIIIDGFALTAFLYNSSLCASYSSFGGDYDKFAYALLGFFELLAKCNVTPIVVCDGGCEKKKVNTIKKRALTKVFSLERISPLSSHVLCFPLMIRHVFKEVLLKNKIDVLQSDFEADNEIAALARKFDIPVLSNDSDFFIFDVKFIPLATVDINGFTKDENGDLFIHCQIFHIDKLLKGLGGLPKALLPLLATLLGNDYIKASQFSKFYNLLKKETNKRTSASEKRVKAVVNWLKDENFESALAKILGCMKKQHRKVIRKGIKNIVKGYTNLNTPLEAFLSSDTKSKLKTNSMSGLAEEFHKIVINDSESDEDDVDTGSEASDENNYSEGGTNSNSELEEDSTCVKCFELSDIPLDSIDYLPAWLLSESRKANLCPKITSLLSLRIYFFDPQVEDYSLSHAGSIILPVLQTIMGCIGIDSITYWSRIRKSYRGTQLSAIPQEESFCENCMKNQLSEFQRKEKIFRTLKIENSEIIESFPPEWRLYIMSIVYWIQSASEVIVRPCHIHAVIITLISVNVIGSKVGVFQHRKNFLRKYGSKLKSLANKKVQNPIRSSGCESIEDMINLVSMEDCILGMDLLFQYFQVDENLKRRPQEFSRSAVHLFVQLQYSFMCAVTFNSLLLMPFKRSNLSMFYNGTFLYNFSVKLKNYPNIITFFENLFLKLPIFISLYKSIYDKLCYLATNIPKQKIKTKKPKSRKRPEAVKLINIHPASESACEEEIFEDANNKFSILSKVM